MKINDVVIYTDGACSGNPGPGGWCALLICSEKQKSISGRDIMTTNNQMELTAVIKGLKALKYPCNVIIRSDSAYIVNQVNGGYLDKWEANGWRTSTDRPVANVPLWQDIVELRKVHNVTFEKVKGHSGDINNELADKEACIQRDLAADELPVYIEQKMREELFPM